MKKYVLTMLLVMFCTWSFSKDTKLKGLDRICRQTISLNGNDWRIAIDSDNTGRKNAWFKTPPVPGSKQTPVPWIIQDIFPDYHGVVWYWREFDTPENLHQNGRYLLRFHAVDYLADVWVNSKYIGVHEGSETPFDMDVTDILNPGGKNLLVVRVLNPTYEPIDGIALKDTPSGAKQYPVSGNAAYNTGGITGPVELLVTAAVYLKDLFVVPDWESGMVKIQATVINTLTSKVPSMLSFQISEDRTGVPVGLENSPKKLISGKTIIETKIQLSQFKLWSPEYPNLYRVTTVIETSGSSSVDERSVRVGFRNFRFENGYFRLNGKRIFLKGSNFGTHYPVGYTVPLYEDMLRRDVINMKALGYNFVRIPFGCPNSRVLDIYDEMGILVQMEHYGCWQMGDYGKYEFQKPDNREDLLTTRFENSVREVIMRDRNHASVVMWGLLNETPDNKIFKKAVGLLPSLRIIDPLRLFVLNSGRFDNVNEIGSMSNPGSVIWDVKEGELKDWHPYVWMPYSPQTLNELSGRSNTFGQKVYISETGLCFPIDLPSELGDYQQWGKEQCDEARYFKRQYDKFLLDWKKFDLGSCWARPEDYIKDAYKTAASLRETAETAIRSNPFVVSYTPTNSVADGYGGESVATNFRKLKPEMIGAVLLANSSLRWCLSTEPQSIFRGRQVQLSVSFSNLDLLKPGEYPATIQVIDPDMKYVYEKKVSIHIFEKTNRKEPPFAQSILTENITINGPAGKYFLLATLDKGGTAVGGKTAFYVTDEADLPQMPREVVVCGTDSVINSWMKGHNIKTRPFDDKNQSKREVILIINHAPDSTTMLSIARQMACGSVAVFLSPSTFRSGKNLTRWLPLANKGIVTRMDHVAGYYRADRWSKNHPIFDGMPSGGMLDYKYFRNIISADALSQEYAIVAGNGYSYENAGTPLKYPSETICGATRISHTYCSGVHLGVWNFGQGQFIVNTLQIGENLGKDPAADRLFCNLLNYASSSINKPMSKLPENFNQQLLEIGY